MRNLNILGAAAIIGVGAMAAQRAEATLAVSFQSGVGPISICQDQAACDTNLAVGAINATVNPLGPYDFVIDVAQSYPAVGSAGAPVLRLTSIGNTDVTGLSNTTALTVRATQTGFNLPGQSAWDLGAGIQFPALADSSAPNATAAYSFYLDNTDTQFGTTTLLGTELFTFTNTAVSAQATNQLVQGTGDASFSLTTQIVFNGLDGGIGFSSNAAISSTQIPEPASMAVLGMGLLGLGAFKRGRNRA